MKHQSSIWLATAMLLLPLCPLAQSGTSEQDAIQKTIEAETRAWQLGNYELWTSYWGHEANCYYSITWPGLYWRKQGWEEISAYTKSVMDNSTPGEFDTGRHDFQFVINGNMSVVTFLEGNNNEATCTLEKRDGKWKIIRWEEVAVPFYAALERSKSLQPLAGIWKADLSTYKADPPAKGGELLDFYYENEATETGMRLSHWRHWKNEFGTHQYNRKEELVSLPRSEDLKMFVVHNNSFGWTGFDLGKAKLAADGTLNQLVQRPNSEKLAQTSRLSLQPDGRLHLNVESYDADGKVNATYSVELVRQ